MYLAVWSRRQGTRCEGYCDAMPSVPLTALRPRLDTAIHIRGAVTPVQSRNTGLLAVINRSTAWISSSEVTLNVLEPGAGNQARCHMRQDATSSQDLALTRINQVGSVGWHTFKQRIWKRLL